MIPLRDLSLYVLAGGLSSRFGMDKALANIGDAPLICDVIDSLTRTDGVQEHNIRQQITLVTGKARRYDELGYRVITDRPAGVGPLGGLYAALHDQRERSGSGWVLLAGCDLVRPDHAWVTALLGRINEDGCLAVAYRGKRWEPMPAIYHTDLLPVVEQQLRHGNRSFQKLLDITQTVGVSLPDGLAGIPQANTPEQLRQALRERGAA